MVDSDIVAQLRDLGAPQHVIDAAQASRQPVQVDFLVWQENWRAVSLFLALETQWLLHMGMAGVYYQGLNYVAAEASLRLARVPRHDWPELFADLRTMERAALPLMNEKK